MVGRKEDPFGEKESAIEICCMVPGGGRSKGLYIMSQSVTSEALLQVCRWCIRGWKKWSMRGDDDGSIGRVGDTCDGGDRSAGG